MPTLAGWLTGEQVPQEVIDQTLLTMGEVLGRHGGEPARTTMPGAGLIAFSDTTHSMRRNDDPPVLDWVPDRRTMVYRRPLSGVHQLYYLEDWPAQGNLLFASEIKALLAVGAPRRLFLPAIAALLRYGFIPAPWTAFKDIFTVPAGSILRWQRAKTVVNTSTDFHLDEPLPQQEALQDRLYRLLEEATQGMLPPHDAVMALSGGGLFSALATALTARQYQQPFTLATLGYTKTSGTKGWKQAESIAAVCQTPFLAITGVDQPDFWLGVLAGLEAPCTDTRTLALHQLLHTAAVETGARIGVTGLGAHQIAFDLPSTYKKSPPTRVAPEQEMLSWYAQTLSPQMTKIQPSLWSTEAEARLREEKPWEETLPALKLARKASQFSDQRLAWHYLDLHLRFPEAIVNPMHKLATPEGVGIRSPYLNPHVIDLLTRLPADEQSTAKTLLTQIAQQVLPDQRLESSRLPLVAPIPSLFEVEHSELLQQTLSPTALETIGIFNPQAIGNLLSGKNKKEGTRVLIAVFTTQLLCQLYGLSIS